MYSCGGNNIGYAGNGIGCRNIYRSDTIRITELQTVMDAILLGLIVVGMGDNKY